MRQEYDRGRRGSAIRLFWGQSSWAGGGLKNRAKRGDTRALPFYKFTHNNQLKVSMDDGGGVGENAWLERKAQGGCRVAG